MPAPQLPQVFINLKSITKITPYKVLQESLLQGVLSPWVHFTIVVKGKALSLPLIELMPDLTAPVF